MRSKGAMAAVCRCRGPEKKDKAFGFNDSGRAWLPQPDWFADYAESGQEGQDDSTLNLYRQAVAIRKRMVKHGADIDLEMVAGRCLRPGRFRLDIAFWHDRADEFLVDAFDRAAGACGRAARIPLLGNR